MRHRKAGVKLNRTASHRQAMFRNMVTSLFKNERIRTTDAKAKELRRWADHIITLAKRGDLHARRQAMSIVREKQVVHKLFEEAKERYGSINGGYTRIVKIGRRPGDAAPISLIELVSADTIQKKKKKKAKPAARKKTESAPKPAADKEPVTGQAGDDKAQDEQQAGALADEQATQSDDSEQTAPVDNEESAPGAESDEKPLQSEAASEDDEAQDTEEKEK